ncbi:magnesium transporter CorA [Kitasatospora herbaricolor]|uniref:magnesium/cobalt transporter CorA n=1 Tax=Kitasatospora herbaricolor TaxID=68217 RepID=UPI00174A0D01|nr:magnesium/cobalt transporter CorA [Kitasatospora herbaricolor]MDQ0310460.1 magnesium transporter [Kitasatospora herbaricolor]GGV07459.1 magnesium transporter CorA [Kitasatospora herbaricolor]
MSMINNLRAAVRPHRRRPGDDAYDSIHPGQSPSAVVDCAVYQDGKRHGETCSPREAARRVKAAKQLQGTPGSFSWIGLHEPTEAEFEGIAQRFGLHPLAVEDAVHAHQRPKVERYDDVLFAVFKTIRYVEHDQLTPTSEVVETGELMVFAGQDFVITVRHGGHSSLQELRRRMEQDVDGADGTALLAKGPSAVLHAIADHVVDNYLEVANRLQSDVDEIEFDVFANKGGKGTDVGRVYQLKREVLEFKRAVTPLLRPMQQLSEPLQRLVDPDIQKYFRDVADHLARVTEQVHGFDELLNSLLQANLAQVSVAQNEDMRKITAWAAIFAVPTMITGVYGMNFDYMPELHHKYGYPMVLLGVATICVGMYRGFRRNGWL